MLIWAVAAEERRDEERETRGEERRGEETWSHPAFQATDDGDVCGSQSLAIDPADGRQGQRALWTTIYTFGAVEMFGLRAKAKSKEEGKEERKKRHAKLCVRVHW